MLRENIRKQFFRFVIPSMMSMMLNGLYTIVDGFFIGHAVGDVGLAGIGLAWPITAVLIALGMGIGVGGSVQMSVYRGAGKDSEADHYRASTLLLLGTVSAITTIVLLLFNSFFLKVLGAEGEVYDAAYSYIQIISLGGSMQIFTSGMLPLIRNSHMTVQAMGIMIAGLICNIILDWLFTMKIPMGLGGAALATIIAQGITATGCVFFLWRLKENRIRFSQFKWKNNTMLKIIKIGVSPFGISLMPSLITVFNNWQCLKYGGNFAVSAYAVINYFLASVLLLLEGIGEGVQPLISYYKGAKEYKTMEKIRNMGVKAVLTFSALFLLSVIPAKSILPAFFGTSEQTAEIIREALPILVLAFPMMGIGKLFSSYFYACEENISSMLMIYSDPICFTPLCIFVLPKIWQLKGVWLALPGAQFLVMVLLTFLFIQHKIKLRTVGGEKCQTY